MISYLKGAYSDLFSNSIILAVVFFFVDFQ